jgi:hypothetical protein
MYIKVIYTVWFLIPLAFFLMALWATLEKIGKSPKKQHPADFSRQGAFALLCVFVALGVDQYLLQPNEGMFSEWLPLPVVQVLLLPIVLSIGAAVWGGSKPIKITKFGRTSSVKQDSKRPR